jgi:hypothetical protein
MDMNTENLSKQHLLQPWSAAAAVFFQGGLKNQKSPFLRSLFFRFGSRICISQQRPGQKTLSATVLPSNGWVRPYTTHQMNGWTLKVQMHVH